jgi:hypothetical protein
MQCLQGYNNPICTSQETHVSTSELSWLMLCKIWGFHAGDYEVWHFLRKKNPVHTSQETHYVSVTEPSQLRLYKVWGFHAGDYEECRLLGWGAMWILLEWTFQRNCSLLVTANAVHNSLILSTLEGEVSCLSVWEIASGSCHYSHSCFQVLQWLITVGNILLSFQHLL